MSIGCAWFGVMFAREWMIGARMHEANNAREYQIRACRLQGQQLEHEIHLLDTQASVLREARKAGWIMPNEQKLRLPGN